MRRQERSEQSRREVLDAALRLFSKHGFRATTVREIADAARVSTGNVYHHFPDKESIFRSLLDEFSALTGTQRYPYRRALTGGSFPENIEELGAAARDSVRQFRQYVALIYVDVLEFDGTHIRKFYGEMASRYATLLEQDGSLEELKTRLRGGVSPVSALLLTSRIFFTYFTLEILFNVPEPFGNDSDHVIREIADILRRGIVA